MTTRVAVVCTAAREAALREYLERDGDVTVTAWLSARVTEIPPPAEVLVVEMESAGTAALDLIARVMSVSPLPIVALCPDDATAPAAMEALLRGAVEAIPAAAVRESGGELLRDSVRRIRGVRVVRRRAPRPPPAPPPHARRRAVVAMAASTGGPAALAEVLGGVPRLAAPVLLVQHLHDSFVAGFVSWLGGYSSLPVSQAVAGQALRPGHVYVAPAGRHLRLHHDGTLMLADSPQAVHVPSADVLFESVAEVTGSAGIGVLLTGMGADGAAGLLAMRRAGAVTFVQDEASCVVFGMPKAALALGAADRALPPEGIAKVIRTAVERVTR